MPFITVEVKIYETLGYCDHRDSVIVGDHKVRMIKADSVKDLFKEMVMIFRAYNREAKEREEKKEESEVVVEAAFEEEEVKDATDI